MDKAIHKLKELEQTHYWDKQLLDFQIKYLGDEAKLFIDTDDDNFCWEVKFLRCSKVSYDTDAGWVTEEEGNRFIWRTTSIKDMRGGQLLGYSLQNIHLEQKDYDFYDCRITLANMQISIVCQDIVVKQVLVTEDCEFYNFLS